MLNGDTLSDLDLTAQIAQHERTGARLAGMNTGWTFQTFEPLEGLPLGGIRPRLEVRGRQRDGCNRLLMGLAGGL